MPTRLDQLLGDEGMLFEPPILPETAEKAVLLPKFGVTLRKLNDEKTRYDPSGRYYETIVDLANWSANGLTSLFGFELDEFVDPNIPGVPLAQRAKLGFQLSNDDGASWLIWQDGPDAWVPAVGVLANVFNDKEIVDRRIPLFPLCNRQVRLRVKLTPGVGGRQRPVLRQTMIYNRHDMDIYEDVTRSIKRYIDGAIQLPMFFYAEIATPSQTIEIERDTGLDVTVVEPIRVYNLTTDPGKCVNLFASLGGCKNRTVTLTSPQIGQLEVQFIGVPDVFIGAEDFFQISKIPSIVAIINTIECYLELRSWPPETERAVARGEGRLQFSRLFYIIRGTIRSQSALKREALQMSDGLLRILDQGQEFPSVASGEDYCIMENEGSLSEDRVAQGLFVTAVNLKILGKMWLNVGPTEEPNLLVENGVTPLVKSVNVFVGAENSCNLNLPKHLRRVYREELPILFEQG